MASKRSRDRTFFIVNIVLIVSGFACVALRLGLTSQLTIIDKDNAAQIADFLLAAWVGIIIVWLVMVVQRRRRDQTRRNNADARARRGPVAASSTRSPNTRSLQRATSANSVMPTQHRQQTVDSQFNTLQPLSNAQHQTVTQTLLEANSKLKVDALLGRPARPTAWTLGVLQQLEWRRFEQVCVGLVETMGYSGVSISNGPDDEASLYLIQHDAGMTHALVKTAAGNGVVEVDQIRALYAAMTRQQILQGFCITAGEFVPEAIAAARGVGLFAIDGATLLQKLNAMPALQQEDLLKRVFQGDYAIPSCPSCGKTMTLRDAGVDAIWRCSDYPTCKAQLRPPQASSQAA